MKIRIMREGGLSEPLIIDDVKTVVVIDDHDNPIYAAEKRLPGVILHEKAGSSGFDKFLRALGVKLQAVYEKATLHGK